jgi:lysophospholipase L1-like esterase
MRSNRDPVSDAGLPAAQVKLVTGLKPKTSAARRAPLSLLKILVIAVLTSAFLVPPTFAGDDREAHWTGTWGVAPAFLEGNTVYKDQTLRFIVHTSLRGSQVRVKFSNTFGSQPLRIGAAHIALRKSGAQIFIHSDRALTFSGRQSINIPVGALVISDPVYLTVPPLVDLAVSVYLPGVAPAVTGHLIALQTSFVAHGPGDFTSAGDLPGAGQTFEWDFLSGVDVLGNEPAAAVVVTGGSETDGLGSTSDANRRWTDVLARRLQSHNGRDDISVLNEAIGGNRILHPAPQVVSFFGPATLARFDRDVLAQAGVKYLIVLLGLNDIAEPGVIAPPSEDVSAEDVIAGHLQIIARAREKGIKAYGCTILPFEGSLIGPGFYTAKKEAKREEVNHWIRTSGAYDAVIDFDKVVRDPTHPKRLLPAFDSGDHTHPNDAGYKAMGQAIDLALFSTGYR